MIECELLVLKIEVLSKIIHVDTKNPSRQCTYILVQINPLYTKQRRHLSIKWINHFIKRHIIIIYIFDVLAQLVQQQIANLSCRFLSLYRFTSCTRRYAVCPGGEGAVLKIVGLKGLARSNRVHGACGMNVSALFHWNTLLAARMILLRAERDRPAVFR